ncbi:MULTISPECIES: aminodeoxychorismate synthase component I [unclassified Gordonia (in: high G+C Gram-positive bacteria)]|uniref:aminodeoxychorismate synthase component I n=1 Tax=unclassified Gordonia (in: high G+C Gram-positive bacteria) TaxID=2657482 RepID=UPI0009AC109F|nr:MULTISPECIES: aminodeoxychorismate synthase component I [unclassified Gordonia (in: high G+C Gram-positive bacteria)]MDF3282530.1 aminodeoxychorismate synthase component I [Gordonia sp. N1V]OPX09446.1 aminodeoxychorismate synthase component I [Gordonia sp. i37]
MTATALDVLRSLQHSATKQGVPGPAALIGDWWDADAVIAPSIEIRAGSAPADRTDRFWLGYCGFDGSHAPAATLPSCAGGLTERLLVLRSGQWRHVSVDGSPQPDWVTRAMDDAALGRVGGNPLPSGSLWSGSRWSARWMPPDHAHHVEAIEKCLEAIRAGDIYQACVCTRFTGHLEGSALEFYLDLTGATRPAKSAFLQGEWGAVASFSPETFLRRTGNIVSSSPIKGTIAADADPSVLSASTKDIAENIMIVDLVRNDLGRVAVTGSVRVADLLTVVPAPGVWHLVSRVEAIVAPDVGNSRLLDATWPPASVTGTPKLRARGLLAEWESSPRGVYCGAVGLAGPDALLDLNVAIRTVEISPGGGLELGVGGGITIDSDPEREWQECLDKAASIISAQA